MENIKSNSKNKKSNLFLAIIGTILFLYAIVMVLVLVWALLATLKPYSEFLDAPLAFPNLKTIQLDNWIKVFNKFVVSVEENDYYIESLFIFSLIYSLGCSFCASIVTCIMAYAVSKYKYKFSSVIYAVVIIAMILPIVGALPSEMQMLNFLNLYDKFIGVFIMKSNFLGIYFLIYYATFKGIPWTYAESAFIDGASHFKVMVRIMIPLVKTTFLAVFLLNFIMFWNDYQGPMLYLPSYPTLSFGLFYMKFNSTVDFGRENLQLTCCMLVALPIIIMFIIFQKRLMGNLAVGGIKG